MIYKETSYSASVYLIYFFIDVLIRKDTKYEYNLTDEQKLLSLYGHTKLHRINPVIIYNTKYQIYVNTSRNPSMRRPTLISNIIRSHITKITNKLYYKDINKHTYLIIKFIFLNLVKLFKLLLCVRSEHRLYDNGKYISTQYIKGKNIKL